MLLLLLFVVDITTRLLTFLHFRLCSADLRLDDTFVTYRHMGIIYVAGNSQLK